MNSASLMQLTQIPMNTLVPSGNALLLLSFGYSVIQSQREGRSLEPTFVALALGILGITFSGSLITGVRQLSDLLTLDVQKLGDAQALKKLVWQSIQTAASEPDSNGRTPILNIPAVIEQLFRTGVWGIASTVTDFFFILSTFFIEVRRDILLAFVQFLIPLIFGLYPVRPDLGNSIIAYIVEMGLWGPCLYLIQIITVQVAPKYLGRSGSLGVPLVALEIVATLLILEVPRIVHQLLRGSLHPGGESAALGLMIMGSRSFSKASRLTSQDSQSKFKSRRRRQSSK